MYNDDGFSLGSIESLIPWRELDVDFLVEGKGDVYKPLHMIFGEGLVVEALENQSKDANQKVCDKERASRK